MKERPILFSGEMVNAILDGRKTETRRVIKPQFSQIWGQGVRRGEDTYSIHVDIHEKDGSWKWIKSPYGRPGDRLWVRETCYLPGSGYFDESGEWRDTVFTDKSLVKYAATDEPVERKWFDNPYRYFPAKKPSIFMPRWASRITLEVTAVRVERVQDITDLDCYAEGAYHPTWTTAPGWPKAEFSRLWNEINAKRGYSWESNPWVWVIEFKRVQP